MKNNNILFVAALATMAGLTSCSNDEDSFVLKTDTPMTVSAGVSNLTTRAGYTTNNVTGSDFGLFLTTDGSTSGETNYYKYNATNLKFEYTNNTWSIASEQKTSQLLWKSSTNTVSYIAYMPYDENMTLSEDGVGTSAAPTDYSFSVQTNQSTDANVMASDFLYCKETGVKQPLQDDANNNIEKNAINIEFKHIMSKLKVVLKKATELSELTGDDAVTFKTVTLSSANIKSTIDLTTGTPTAVTISDDNPAQDITLCDVSDEMSNDIDADAMFECIIVPQTLTSLTVTIEASNNKSYQFVGTTKETFDSSYAYTLSLEVGRDKVKLGTITAAEWTPNSTDGSGNQTSDGTLTTE